MKKTKLLSTIFGSGVLLASAPIVATSCTSDSDSKENYCIVNNEKISLPTTLTQGDINGLISTPYTYAKDVTRASILVNNEFVPADLVTELQIGQTDGVVNIPNGFLYGCSHLKTLNLKNVQVESFTSDSFFPSSESNLQFSNLTKFSVPTIVSEEASIGDNFLTYFKTLKTVDLSGFNKVTNIGDYFLATCKSLTKVDFSPMTSLITIGGYCLNNDISLTEVDLNGLTSLTTIGMEFVAGCSFLTDIKNFNTLTSLKTIGNYFANRTSLKSFKLSGLANLKSIDSYFLADNFALTEVELSDLPQLQTIGYYFCSQVNISYTNGIEKLTLWNLPSLKQSTTSTPDDYGFIGTFLYFTPNLKTVIFSDNMSADMFYTDNSNVTAKSNTDPAYVNGVTIVGNADFVNSFMEKFPNSTSPLRKLIASPR